MKLFGRKGLSKEMKYLVVIIVVLLILCLGFGYCLRFTRIEGMIPPDDNNINAINRLENFLKNTKIYIPKDLRYFTKRVIDGTRPFTARINKNIEIELVNRFIYNVKNKDIESARKLIEMHGADPQYFKDDNNLKSGDSKEKNNEEEYTPQLDFEKNYIPKDEKNYIPKDEKYGWSFLYNGDDNKDVYYEKNYIPKDEKYDWSFLYNGDFLYNKEKARERKREKEKERKRKREKEKDNKYVYYEMNLIKEPQKTDIVTNDDGHYTHKKDYDFMYSYGSHKNEDYPYLIPEYTFFKKKKYTGY